MVRWGGTLTCNGKCIGVVIRTNHLSGAADQTRQQVRDIARATADVQYAHPFSDSGIDKQALGEIRCSVRHGKAPQVCCKFE
jgi:N-acetyl-anhydromuramyl-L-alanine amidase AmpD